MNKQLQTTDFYRQIHNFPTNKRDYQARIKTLVRRLQEKAAAAAKTPEEWNEYFAGCNRVNYLTQNALKYAENSGADNFLTLWKQIHQLPESFQLADLKVIGSVNEEMRRIDTAIRLAKNARKEADALQSEFYGELFELTESELAEIEAGFHTWRADCRAGIRNWND